MESDAGCVLKSCVGNEMKYDKAVSSVGEGIIT